MAEQDVAGRRGRRGAGGARAAAPLDPEVAARRDAALAHVRVFGDPVLKAKARPVEVFDDRLREEVARMGALMNDALGIGLAATQVGVLHRVLVYRVEHDSPVNALINPVLEWSGGEKETMEEGCLSLPGVHVDVERPTHVRVRAQDATRRADPRSRPSGLEARVIQHEMDHLDGVLILERTLARPAQGGHADPPRAPRGRLSTAYLGTSAFAAAVLERLAATDHRPALVVTRPDRAAGRGRKLTPPPVADAARELGLELFQPESVNTRRGGRAGGRDRAPTSSSCAPSARSSRSRC